MRKSFLYYPAVFMLVMTAMFALGQLFPENLPLIAFGSLVLVGTGFVVCGFVARKAKLFPFNDRAVRQ